MEGWQIGLIAVVVIGLAAIVLGAVRDRRLNERRRRDMLAPPERSIPRFAPDSPTPRYLSELQARRRPPDAVPTDLSDGDRDRLRAAIQQQDTLTVDVGCVPPELITDEVTGWTVLHRPDVLVSAAPITTVRELLGILEHQIPTGRPLVVVAPSISRELIATFEVNHLQRVITIVPISAADEEVRTMIAEATGATTMSHPDLQSGFHAPGLLGSCATWVSTRRSSHLMFDDVISDGSTAERTNG